MRQKYTTIEDFNKEVKRRERRAKFVDPVVNRIKDLENWFYNNKEFALGFGIPATIGVGNLIGKVIKGVSRSTTIRKEQRLKDNYVYDRTGGIGHYWELRRKPTNREWDEIYKRKQRGETLSSILDDMGLKKR
jgi:hypothetical protein